MCAVHGQLVFNKAAGEKMKLIHQMQRGPRQDPGSDRLWKKSKNPWTLDD
jgi:hypothetical protein